MNRLSGQYRKTSFRNRSIIITAAAACLLVVAPATAQTPPPAESVVIQNRGLPPTSYEAVRLFAVDRQTKKISRTWSVKEAYRLMQGELGSMYSQSPPPLGAPAPLFGPSSAIVAAAYHPGQGDAGQLQIDLYLLNFSPKLHGKFGPATGIPIIQGSSDMGMGSMGMDMTADTGNDPFGLMGTVGGGEPSSFTVFVQRSFTGQDDAVASGIAWDAQESAIVGDSIRQTVRKRLLTEQLNRERGIGPVAEKAAASLREVLNEECVTDAARRELELGEIEQRLKVLRDEQALRIKQQEQIVDVRLNQLLLTAQGLLAN